MRFSNSLRTAVLAAAGALLVTSAQAGPMPTSVATIKSMVDPVTTEVRWGYGYRGYGYRVALKAIAAAIAIWRPGYRGYGYRGYGYRGLGYGVVGAVVGAGIARAFYGGYGGYYGSYRLWRRLQLCRQLLHALGPLLGVLEDR